MNTHDKKTLISILLFASCCAYFTAGYAESCKGGAASSLSVTGDVEQKARYSLGDLQNFTLDPNTAYTPTVVTVTFATGSGQKTATYTGIPLNDLLTAAAVKVDPDQKNDILRKYVVAHGTDCYEALIALGEVLPRFENKQVIVAYADGEGNPLPESEGMARLIVPGDIAGGRYVSNLSRLIVGTPDTLKRKPSKREH